MNTTNTNTLFPTRVSVAAEDRSLLGDHLNRSLATLIDLYTQVKQAHWNIKGPWFFARHELFDKIGANLLGFSDDIAERASALGHATTGTARQAAEQSILEPYPEGVLQGKEHLRALADRYGKTAAMLRESVSTAERHDPVTHDLLVGTLRQIELDLWFLESHLND